ncbi:hypothetical protein AVEN_51383-1 [Araneus ventricosus]|uniref:Uncharacterized protein n=1 Tax=Araneus ventricosus TaxID=182803 RepID=A0A4Y2MRD1_ARAVE|nr:hypothetical protein AVEN_51383-1 [Araneus ventricosus]
MTTFELASPNSRTTFDHCVWFDAQQTLWSYSGIGFEEGTLRARSRDLTAMPFASLRFASFMASAYNSLEFKLLEFRPFFRECVAHTTDIAKETR